MAPVTAASDSVDNPEVSDIEMSQSNDSFPWTGLGNEALEMDDIEVFNGAIKGEIQSHFAVCRRFMTRHGQALKRMTHNFQAAVVYSKEQNTYNNDC
jgi:hypothetical protein